MLSDEQRGQIVKYLRSRSDSDIKTMRVGTRHLQPRDIAQEIEDRTDLGNSLCDTNEALAEIREISVQDLLDEICPDVSDAVRAKWAAWHREGAAQDPEVRINTHGQSFSLAQMADEIEKGTDIGNEIAVGLERQEAERHAEALAAPRPGSILGLHP